MFGFDNLASEVKDRFIKDRFWSAVFVSLVICNWRVFLILASDLKYAEKIAVIEFSLIENAWVSFVIAFSVATFRTFIWPPCSKGIEYFLFRVKEKGARSESFFLSKGVIDARSLIIAIQSFQERRANIKRTINDLNKHAERMNDQDLFKLVEVLEFHNESIFHNLDEKCKELGLPSNDINTLTGMLNGSIPETANPTKKTLKKFWDFFEKARR